MLHLSTAGGLISGQIWTCNLSVPARHSMMLRGSMIYGSSAGNADYASGHSAALISLNANQRGTWQASRVKPLFSFFTNATGRGITVEALHAVTRSTSMNPIAKKNNISAPCASHRSLPKIRAMLCLLFPCNELFAKKVATCCTLWWRTGWKGFVGE